MRVLYIPYALWKTIAQANGYAVYEQPTESNARHVWMGGLDVVFRADVSDSDYSDYNTNFPSPTAVASEDEALANIVGLAATTQPRNSRNEPLVMVAPPEATRVDVISLNWCDRTTWYSSATQVVDEAMSDGGTGLIWNLPTSRTVIDVTHGKITGEHELRPTHQPVIKVDGTPMVENGPGLLDHDYTIDYATGDVTFNTSQAGKTVTASYYYESGSSFTVQPESGKILRLTQVEVQFSENIVLNDTVLFQLYVGGAPYGPPTVYQTMLDYINEASLSYPSIPQMGGVGWRGMKGPVHIFRWPYAERGTLDLKSSLGMEIRVSLEGDAAFGGDVAVATFYGLSLDEAT